MAVFTAKVRHVKLTWSPFTSEQMLVIGDFMVQRIKTRIFSATDVTDSPAKPLASKYADAKVKGLYVRGGGAMKYTGKPIRDWKLRGWTMASCMVKSASEDKVTIGFINAEANKIVSAQNRMARMWGVSDKDHEALVEVVKTALTAGKNVRWEKTA